MRESPAGIRMAGLQGQGEAGQVILVIQVEKVGIRESSFCSVEIAHPESG